MGVYKLQLSDGKEKVVEAGRAVRTADGHILLEDTDQTGTWQLLETFEPAAISAVLRRGATEGGIYTWEAQPDDGRWWLY